MKTKIILLSLLVTGLTMTSCKKTYTCKCDYTIGGSQFTSNYSITDTKSNAKTQCENYSTNLRSAGTCVLQ
jgi:hypothetical protein